ncbi:hypothetical protein [Mycobacterium lepromatosis]|nr:hypothetical protein [Mycobacterium lepromatosis]
MAVLDITVLSVAQRAFIVQFKSTQAIITCTMTGYMLALATMMPITE